MGLKRLLYILGISVILTGCSGFASSVKEGQAVEDETGCVKIGNSLTFQNMDERMVLINNVDTLASDGLYYASWGIGDSEPYENSDGDTVDLYDAQIYLLLGEFSDTNEAQDSMNKWLETEKINYEVVSEEEVTCAGQSYVMLTYNCINEDNPYDRGMSAFGLSNNSAICVELTCTKEYEDDLRAVLTDFLNNCTYNEREDE